MKRPILAAVALAFAAGPATASAATIQLGSSISYEAGAGEVNAVEMRGTLDGPRDVRMAFFEYSAPLFAGPGCVAGLPTICGAADRPFPVDVSLGDHNDVASVNSFTSRLALDAGSGNDDVLAGGIDAAADGGSGNDIVHLAASDVATGNGGSGRDQLAAGLGAAVSELDGGSGGDLLVPGAFVANEATGGSGDDQLVSFTGRGVTLDGGSGADVLLVPTAHGTITLEGGSGNDLVSAGTGGVTVDAGSGADLIDVRGDAASAGDTVSCGSGRDKVWANNDDEVARDCEVVVKASAPDFAKSAAADAAARALLAHRPNPSGL
jgi:Ca2+-binding RTX toxin-like protein